MSQKVDTHLTATQQLMVKAWEQHMAAEFQLKDLEATMATMTEEPCVNHVPVMTGGVGQEAVRHFYGNYFIPCQPPDTEIIPVSRTVGYNRIVDQIIHKFTHTVDMPWMLPGLEPTGKPVVNGVVAIIDFQNGKVASEHIYWDQASVLVQLELLDPNKLPVVGADSAEKILNPFQRPSNTLIQRGKKSR
ncbi:MAG: nuclear transport factor 2 family protein [Nitrospirota bacterium]|nr:MAG: nuclear transport factor 2 family protein [Nitrospirota bacterium]